MFIENRPDIQASANMQLQLSSRTQYSKSFRVIMQNASNPRNPGGSFSWAFLLFGAESFQSLIVKHKRRSCPKYGHVHKKDHQHMCAREGHLHV